MTKTQLKSSTALFKTSQSKVGAWLLCKQKYHYKEIEHLERKKKPRPLKFGNIIHEMVEAEAEGQDPFKVLKKTAVANRQLFLEEEEMYGNIVEDIQYIMTEYFTYWEQDPLVYVKINGRYTEHKLEVDMGHGLLFKGKADGVAKSKGRRWLIEHKSHKNIPNDDHRWRNVQSNVYMPIWDMMGYGQLEGTLWDYIRSKPPTRPQLLKSGGLSERQLDSLPSVVLDVLKQNRLDPKNYKALIKSQELNRASYFQRVYTPAKAKVTKNIMKDFVETSLEMADKSGKVKTKTIGQHCNWCEYEGLCRAEMQGSDVDFVKEREYQVVEDRYADDDDDE